MTAQTDENDGLAAMEKLRQKMQTLGSTIRELFSLPRATSILLLKLSQLEQTVTTIPEEWHELAAEWRYELAKFWCQYATIIDDQLNDKSEYHRIKQQLIGLRRNVSPAFGSISNFDSIAPINTTTTTLTESPIVGNIVGENFSDEAKYKMTNDGDDCTHHAYREDSNPSDQSKENLLFKSSFETKIAEIETIRSRLRHEFDQIDKTWPPNHDGGEHEIGFVKALLRLCAKTWQSLSSDRNLFRCLHSEAFTLAYDKLSPAKQNEFALRHDRKRSLYALIAYLRNEIVAFYAAAKRSNLSIKNSTFSDHSPKSADLMQTISAQDQSSLIDVAYFCRYCRQSGHLLKQCDALRSTLCFTCFDYGHCAKRCPTITNTNNNNNNNNDNAKDMINNKSHPFVTPVDDDNADNLYAKFIC